MMFFKYTFFFVLIILIVSTAVFGLNSNNTEHQNKFLGKWINIDSETPSITQIVVKNENDLWTIQAWGKCHPTDCDWGAVTLNLIGDSPGDKTFDCAFAQWDSGFSSSYVFLRMQGNQLVVEKITIFKDNSNRSNYRNLQIMKQLIE